VQRIFNRDKIHDTSLTPGNVLNILIHRSPFCVIIIMYEIQTFKTGPLCPTHHRHPTLIQPCTGSVPAATVVMRICRTWRLQVVASDLQYYSGWDCLSLEFLMSIATLFYLSAWQSCSAQSVDRVKNHNSLLVDRLRKSTVNMYTSPTLYEQTWRESVNRPDLASY